MDQHPLETANGEEASAARKTSGRILQFFSEHDGSCFSSLLEETVVDDDKPPERRPRRSKPRLGDAELIAQEMASAVHPGRAHQEAPPPKRRKVHSKRARGLGPMEPGSPFSSHYLTEEQHRIDIRNGLLKLYFDFLEDRMSCWIVEKNCPFAPQPLHDARAAWSSSRSNRLVTRVCKLDEALATANLLSNDDRKQASKSLALAMMTLATQWAHLVNGEDEVASQHVQASGLGNFERRLQKSLWQQANQALGEAMTNPSFKVIYASIIFSLTQRPLNSHDEFTPSKPDLASLHILLERDTSPTYLDFAVLRLRQHQRGEIGRRRGHLASKQSLPLSPDDQRTYAVVLWEAIMFDSMSATINGTSFIFGDADTNVVYGEFNKGPSISSSSEEVMSDDENEITDRTRLQPDLDLWGNNFLSRETPYGAVRMQRTRWPCSYEDAASCLADGIPVLILFYRRIGQLQNLHYRRASLKKIAVGLEATLDVYDHWNATYGLFLEDCVLHHQELPSRVQSWYILLSSNFNMAMLILSDLMEKLDAEYMTIPSSRAPTQQTFHCATSIRFRAAYAISDLARCCCRENVHLQFSESLDINSAIDQSALLRECWPTVLTRSLTYASEIFVKLVQLQKDLGPAIDLAALQNVEERLDDCINALWLLGRKSDIAACANQVLRQIVHPELPAMNADPHVLGH